MGTGEGESRSAQRAPHPALAGLVEDYRGYRIVDAPPGVHHGLPTRTLTLVIAFDDPLEVGWLGRTDTCRRFWAVASGLTTAPAAITHERAQHGVQLALTPAGCRELLGLPAAALAGSLVPLADVLGAAESRLYDAVAAPTSWAGRFDALDAELIRLKATQPAERSEASPELAEAWRWLGSRVGTGTVGALAAEVGWSRRHLTDRFRAEFGIGPKQVARLARFERARDLWGRPRPMGLAEIAARCGFADQAHLTREWRALSGYPPTEWRRAEVPFVQDLAVDG